MKKAVLILAAAAVTGTGFSQVSIDPEAGLNIASIRTKLGNNDASNSDSKTGFSVGAGVTLPIYKGLYVKPGISYQMLGGTTEILGVESATTMHYLRVPVNLGYSLKLSDKAGAIFAEAGPYIGMGLAGKTKVTGLSNITIEKDITFGSKVDETKAFDWGFNFGLGYETPWGVYIKGCYGLGLGNMSNMNNTTMTHNNWNIGVGYRIKI